jgi:GNAT superfamily N-acetyltransferase
MAVRPFRIQADIDPWLELRSAAFKSEHPPAGAWTPDDFHREFIAKPWWSPDRLWVVEPLAGGPFAATIGLIVPAPNQPRRAALHWLAVRPASRGTGLGSFLIRHAERAAWEAGARELWIETHAGWQAATALYRRLAFHESTASPWV